MWRLRTTALVSGRGSHHVPAALGDARRVRRQPSCVPTLLAAVALLGVAASTAAQGRTVTVEGRVLWIAGQTMVIDAGGGPSIRIDLSGVPQSDYQGLTGGELVVVAGALSDDRRRVMWTSIRRSFFGSSGQSP